MAENCRIEEARVIRLELRFSGAVRPVVQGRTQRARDETALLLHNGEAMRLDAVRTTALESISSGIARNIVSESSNQKPPLAWGPREVRMQLLFN